MRAKFLCVQAEVGGEMDYDALREGLMICMAVPISLGNCTGECLAKSIG
jgi:hypothetical protein